MKKIISFLMVLSMLTAAFNMAAAEESTIGKREAEILKGLNIYDTAALEPSVTRSDFATVVTRLMGVNESIPQPEKQVFTDVTTDYPNAGAINYLFEKGIMTGHDDASFKPENNLTCREAAKILVSVLGYHELAEADGGYFAGYLNAAENSGIMKGVKTAYTEEIDTGNLAVMILNALEADMMAVSIKNGEITLTAETGTTIMGKYLNMGKITGIVNGYEYTSLESADREYGEGIADIGGISFLAGKVNLDELIGMNVEAYYYDDAGENVLLYAAEKKNTYTVITTDNIEAATLARVYYYKDAKSSNISKFDVADEAVFIYNGKREILISKEDLIPDMGSIKLIDNNQDNVADVVIITDYEEFAVKGILATEEKITTQYDKETLDFSDNTSVIRFFADGEIAEFGNITKNSILNITRSKNANARSLVKVYITDDSVSGKVTSVIRDDDVSVVIDNGEEYKLSKETAKYIEKNKTFNPDTNTYDYELSYPSTGNSYDFKLNMAGEIADYSIKTEGKNYAYLIKCWLEEEDDCAYIKMYTADGEFIRASLREKFTFNDQKLDGKSVADIIEPYQLIIYELDGEGKISKIKTAEDKSAENWSVAKDDEFILHSKSTETIKTVDDVVTVTYSGQRFYKNFAENKPYYFVDNKTVYFQIPNDKTRETDYKIIKKLGSTDIAVKGPVYIYDVGEGGPIGAMVSGELGGSEDYNTPQMVDYISTALNEDDEECTQITFIDGSSVVLSANVKYSQPATSDAKGSINWSNKVNYSGITARDLKRGDVIQCKVVDGYVENLMVLVHVTNIGPSRVDGDHIAKSGNIVGKVLSVNKEGSRAIIEYEDRYGTMRYQSMGIGGSVFKYTASTGKADYSTTSDIKPGDTVLLNSFWWSIKATFIFR